MNNHDLATLRKGAGVQGRAAMSYFWICIRNQNAA